MIAKVMPKGKSFLKLIHRIFDHDSSKSIEVEVHSGNIEIPFDREDTYTINRMIDGFVNQTKYHAGYDPNRAYVGYHILCFSQIDMELLHGEEEIKQMLEKYILEMGLHATQYVAISHKTAERFYVHLVFNRCMNNRKIYKDSFEKVRAAEKARELSLRLNPPQLQNDSKSNT